MIKIRNMSEEKKSSICFSIANGLTMGITAISTPIFTRLMSVEEYGVVSVYNSWQSILLVIFTLMLSAGVFNNGMIDYKDETKTFTASMICLSCISTVAWFCAFMIFYPQISVLVQLPRILLYAMFANFFTMPAYNFWMVISRFSNQYKKPMVITLLTSLASVLLGVIGIFLFPENSANAKIVFSTVPTVLVYLGIMIYLLRQTKKIVVKKYWKYALSYNIPLIPHYLSNILLGSSDRIMIGMYCSEREAGIYGVVYMLANIMAILISSINVSWTPYLYRNLADDNADRIRVAADKLILLVMFFCILVMMFGNEEMSILAPNEYMEGVYMIPILVLANFFVFLYGLFINVEMYYKKKYFITFATIVAALLNIGLNYLLLPKAGYQVAAVTTLVGNFVLALGHGFFVVKLQKRDIYNFKRIVQATIILIGFTVLYIVLYRYIVLKYIVSGILVLGIIVFRKKIIQLCK